MNDMFFQVEGDRYIAVKQLNQLLNEDDDTTVLACFTITKIWVNRLLPKF